MALGEVHEKVVLVVRHDLDALSEYGDFAAVLDLETHFEFKDS